MDTYDRQVRSKVMRSNRAHGTKSTEVRFRSLLVRAGVRGWKLGHALGLPGRPDVVFPRLRLAAFLDGCFWHGCDKCRSIPVSNRPFWNQKIKANRDRDKTVVRALRRKGWIVLRIWEHELRIDSQGVLKRVIVGCSKAKRRL
jgi:DNA mismatch endonuclease, patch repair protein